MREGVKSMRVFEASGRTPSDAFAWGGGRKRGKRGHRPSQGRRGTVEGCGGWGSRPQKNSGLSYYVFDLIC